MPSSTQLVKSKSSSLPIIDCLFIIVIHHHIALTFDFYLLVVIIVLLSRVLFFVPYAAIMDSPTFANGQNAGMRLFGAFIMTIGIFMVNVKIGIETT